MYKGPPRIGDPLPIDFRMLPLRNYGSAEALIRTFLILTSALAMGRSWGLATKSQFCTRP